MTGNENYVNWKTREIISGKRIMGGFLPLRTNVCCKANLVCTDWEAAWCCWNRASKEKERKLPFHRWESSNFFFFVFQATLLQSQLTRSLSFFYFFFSMLAPAAAALRRRRRRHCTASVKRHHFLYQPHMRAAGNAAPFYTAAVNAPPPVPRRPLSLWIVHGEWFFIIKKIVFK